MPDTVRKRPRLSRLSLSGQLGAIVTLHALALVLVWLAGQGAVWAAREIATTIEPESGTGGHLGRFAATGHPEHFRRHLETLATRAPEAGRQEMGSREPDFALVYRSIRDERAPRWLPAARAALAVMLPAAVLEPVVRAQAEADRRQGRLVALIAALHREGAAARTSPRVARLLPDLKDALADLAEPPPGREAMRDALDPRLDAWQRDAVLAVTATALGLSLLAGFRAAVGFRRAARGLRGGVAAAAAGHSIGPLPVGPGHELAPVGLALDELGERVARTTGKAEAHRLDRALRELESVMQAIPDVICVLDLLGRVDLWNRSLPRVTGLADSALTRRPVPELFREEDRAAVEAALREGLRKGRFEFEASLLGPDDVAGCYHWTGAVLEDEGGALIGLTLSGRDITARKALEHQLAHQAFHDPLTGLPNRLLFMNRLGHALARMERRPEAVAVLFLDLDRFKAVNDTRGHAVGDQLLVEVSARLRQCLRPADTVARLGGDEFAVLLEDVDTVADATAVAERIAQHLLAPFVFDGGEVLVTTSVGIALGGAGLRSPEDLVREADMAMYHAKSQGKACYEISDGHAARPTLEQLDLEIDLRRAVSREDFRVHYQPVADLESGRIVEVEALLRWQHGQRGLLEPSAFLAVGEATGLIVPIGLWVLAEACRQTRAWQAEYPTDPPLVLGVNLSARQFEQPDLAPAVARALGQAGLRPGCLKLEIPEAVVMQDAASALTRLRALKDLGVQLAIDDFGARAPFLGVLERLPVDAVKIDARLVRGVGHDPEDAAIVRAVVKLARAAGLSVSAEGIETADQLAALRAAGCERGQGYYLARPLGADPLARLFSCGLAAGQTALVRESSGAPPAGDPSFP